MREFESGKTSPIMFAHEVIAELGLHVQPNDFLKAFPDFVRGWYPGAEDMLAALASRYSLAMLSNTNPLQWEKLSRLSCNNRLFQKIFLSFETGLMKPDREAYVNVIETLSCNPTEILFFDDNPNNVCLSNSMGREVVFKKVFEPIKPGDVPATHASIELLQEAVGYKPQTSIEEGLQRFADWYVEYYKLK